MGPGVGGEETQYSSGGVVEPSGDSCTLHVERAPLARRALGTSDPQQKE